MKEKLIDLLGDTVAECMPTECLADIADHLIANCVIFATDKNGGSKWIPVTERLPDVRVPVLTYGRKGAVGIGFVQPSSVAKDGKVYFYARYGDSLPTHWMPLPEAPKEGE